MIEEREMMYNVWAETLMVGEIYDFQMNDTEDGDDEEYNEDNYYGCSEILRFDVDEEGNEMVEIKYFRRDQFITWLYRRDIECVVPCSLRAKIKHFIVENAIEQVNKSIDFTVSELTEMVMDDFDHSMSFAEHTDNLYKQLIAQ